MERKETVEPLANYFAGRVSKEFKKGNTILGGMVTSTNRFIDEKQLEILHSSAYSGGIDFQQYFSERNYVFSFKSYMSHVRGSEKALVRTQESSVHYFQRPGAGYIHLDSTRTSLTGYGATTSFGKQYGRLQFQVFLDLFSPGLELNDIGFLNSTDQIMQIAWVGYRFNEPFSIFRSANLNLNQWDAWDFGGNFLFTGFNVNGHAQFKNLWFAGFHVDFESDYRSNIVLRGGPSMLMPGNTSGSLLLETSEQKKFKAELDGSYSFGFNDSYTSYDLEFDLEYKPISNIRISLEPSFSFRNSQLQYVDQFHFDQDDRYIFGSIVQRTVSMSLRLDLVITPELTIQYWGQPFIASGDYSGFKYITDPEAEQYEDRFRLFAEDEIRLDGTEENYLVSEQGGLPAYEFGNPDFNRKEFLSNLVFRWEYRPGSFIYLVWSQGRFGSDLRGNFRPGEDFPDLWDIHPRDVLLLKVSYRLGR
jgi:hypothetical protein